MACWNDRFYVDRGAERIRAGRNPARPMIRNAATSATANRGFHQEKGDDQEARDRKRAHLARIRTGIPAGAQQKGHRHRQDGENVQEDVGPDHEGAGRKGRSLEVGRLRGGLNGFPLAIG